MNPKICSFLLLLLSLARPVLSDKCPDREKLPTTCECQDVFLFVGEVELSCSGSTLGELEDALRLMDKSRRLEVELKDMNLGDLPSRIFDGFNVVKLSISHCGLDALAPPGQTALEGLEETLKVLVISASFTEKERPTALPSLAHLRRLQELDLSNNAITELSDDWFSSPPPALIKLNLYNNGIDKLGDSAFEKLSNLKFLKLDGNRFGPIKRSMLPRPANRLNLLDLDNNGFTSLPDDLFTDMPKLDELSISKNGIANLQKRIFKPIWSQLDNFDVRGNPIQCDSTMEWLFEVKKNPSISGTCQGPVGREDEEIDHFIETAGRGK